MKSEVTKLTTGSNNAYTQQMDGLFPHGESNRKIQEKPVLGTKIKDGDPFIQRVLGT